MKLTDWTELFYAGLPAHVGLLLKNRADQNLADNMANTPLKIAVETANADIVSLWVIYNVRLIRIDLIFASFSV